MAYPSQTPGHRRRRKKKAKQLVVLVIALGLLFAAGAAVLGFSVDREGGGAPGVLWLGVAMMVLSVLVPVPVVIGAIAKNKKDRALREPGTVELLTVATSRTDLRQGDFRWELISEMQIFLDGGFTFRGSYHVSVSGDRMRGSREGSHDDVVEQRHPRLLGGIAPWGGQLPHPDEWFSRGAILRCMYNPMNPDKVLVFPGGMPDDDVTTYDLTDFGPNHVWFHSAT